MYKFTIPLVLLLSLFSSGFGVLEVNNYEFLMPNVYPDRDELYLCTPIRIAPNKDFNIVGFKPNATMHTAHHMLLFGCSEPGSDEFVWDCGEMAASGNEVNGRDVGSPCKAGSQIVYAWARNAKDLELPKGVGFHVGLHSEIKYLVLQVHYMHKFEEGRLDSSGVVLQYTAEKMPRQAGVLLLGTAGSVPPHALQHMDAACTMQEDIVLHPFAFRTHTHGLGVVVSGYLVRQSPDGDSWQLIGKKDPHLPQMFYPVVNDEPIHKGDVVAARCTMNNTRDHTVYIGQTNEDEMCNFYLMYWVDADAPLKQKYCFSAGPPYYSWATAEQNFNRIPEIDASSL